MNLRSLAQKLTSFAYKKPVKKGLPVLPTKMSAKDYIQSVRNQYMAAFWMTASFLFFTMFFAPQSDLIAPYQKVFGAHKMLKAANEDVQRQIQQFEKNN